MRQAAFKGLREDKPAAEVEAEKPAPPAKTEVPQPAAPTSSKPRRGGKVDVMGVLISNPDKPLWPDADDGKPVTKEDLARYYEAVGPWMIDSYSGPPVLDHPRAGRDRRRAVFPAPRHAGHVQPSASS